ncbi:MAG: ribonuclease D [Rickettsiales bacterium]|jgi:ribonuclease D|nr:ribonuclease D [Rickettsiales bacterium]
MKQEIIYLQGDLPPSIRAGGELAFDAEFTGLSLLRDRLCLVQMARGDGKVYVVRVNPPYDCPNLKRVIKGADAIFHFARMDMAMIKKCLGVFPKSVFCTKIASRLVRTSTDRHSLKALVSEYFGIDLSKDEQQSDWADEKLSKRQIEYAAGDVVYLHGLKKILSDKLARERRRELADKCFAFLPARVELDLAGWQDEDIFAH